MRRRVRTDGRRRDDGTQAPRVTVDGVRRPASPPCSTSTPGSRRAWPTPTCTPTQALARSLGRRYAELAPVVATVPRSCRRRGRPRRRAGARPRGRRVRRRGRPSSRRRSRTLRDRLLRAARAARPARRQRRGRRDQVGGGRRGVGAVRRRPAAHVLPLRRAARLEGRGALDATESDLGGYKDVTVAVTAPGERRPRACGRWLKYEGGVHRVQRVPVTESQGRIHTSAAGVLVYPEVGRGRGRRDRREGPARRRLPVVGQGRAGRQHHRLRGADHPPATGVVVSCQNERSQLQNKARAMDGAARRLQAIADEAEAGRRRRPTGAARSAPSTAPSACAPTTTRRTGSPTTASATSPTTSTGCSTATSTRCSTPCARADRSERMARAADEA